MGTKKIGIVGTGGVARGSYLPYLSKRSDVKLCYASRTFSKAEDIAKKFGGTAYASVEEMCQAERPDIGMVLTNESAHLIAARQLLACGVKRIFLEKPMVAKYGQANVTHEDYLDARDFMEEAKAAGCSVAMIFNYRFYDLTRKIQQLVNERKLGKLIQSSWLVNYACWSHCIDLLLAFSEGVNTVAAIGEKKENADLAAAFTTANGGTGIILGTQGTDFAHPLYHVTLNFQGGTICFNDLDTELSLCQRGSDYSETFRLLGNRSRWDKYHASFAKSLEAYLDSVDKNLEPPVPGAAGLAELQFEAALRRSAASGQTVTLE